MRNLDTQANLYRMITNPNRTGLFDMFRFGGGGGASAPLVSSLLVDLSKRNFAQG